MYDGVAGLAAGIAHGIFRLSINYLLNLAYNINTYNNIYYRIIYLKEGAELNLVPVDYCTNAMLIIGYNTSKYKYVKNFVNLFLTIKQCVIFRSTEPKVFNYAPQKNNMIFWPDFIFECLEISYETPLMNLYW